MISQPLDILQEFPIRKSKKQKKAFREAVQAYAESMDYPVRMEKGSMGAVNIVMGQPDSAKYIIGAHYDTPACMILPNFITPTNPLCYLLYQLLVVGALLALALGIGCAVFYFTRSMPYAVLAAYVLYFGVLLLMMCGPANRNNANDNTSGVVTVLETMKSLPESMRDRVCFVLFDLEEIGLVGSASYRKAHKKATENQIVLNLDCVGDGSELVMFPNRKLRKDLPAMEALEKLCGTWGEKSLWLRSKGFAHYPSDQRSFPLGVGFAAFRRKKLIGLYCSRIHTNRDTVLEYTNINILRAALITLVTQ